MIIYLTQPKEFEEDQFKKYPIYSGEDIEIARDDFGGVVIETCKYGITLYFRNVALDDIDKVVIYNRLSKKIIFMNDENIPSFMSSLLKFSNLKCGQDVYSIVDKFFNLKAFL
jgi:hypothetical protein